MWKAGTPPPFPENVLNAAGYQLLGSGRATEALEAFRLNAEAYPNSANAHDSLADAFVALDQSSLALEHAEKALQLLETDPSDAARKNLNPRVPRRSPRRRLDPV